MTLYLYIPIWLYSNQFCPFGTVYVPIFTFQSGYIQIIAAHFAICFCCSLHSNLVIFKLSTRIYLLNYSILYIPIWLYSNETLIVVSEWLRTLHSNLVIFKFQNRTGAKSQLLSLHSNLVIFKWRVLKLSRRKCKPLHSNLVIFKLAVPTWNKCPFYLYIPIWLYSNDKSKIDSVELGKLYIPIWLYSNEAQKTLYVDISSLYIPIWLYSNNNQQHK